MKRNISLFIILSLIVFVFVLSSCEKRISSISTVTTHKQYQNSANVSTTYPNSKKKESSIRYPYPPKRVYSWDYDITITTYRNNLMIGKSAYKVNDTPKMKRFFLPAKSYLKINKKGF